MKLVIVESPAKSKTISHYLGNDYEVEASVGHICDLSKRGKGGYGVDIEHDFHPTYVIDSDKKQIINNLKKLVKKADEVYLATDPDREGEAIAYHLANFLELPIDSTKRLEFHEITKNAILNSIDSPRLIDMNLVHSQETRRIIDRILGFSLSKLLKSKIGSESAGRVQSVTLRLICEHEEEILKFIPIKYYDVSLTIDKNNKNYDLKLYEIDNKKVNQLKDKDLANKILNSISSNIEVSNINKKEKSVQSKEPFRTSTLQQAAFSYLGFTTKETTYLSQKLYEGVKTNEGLVGLITYIRTDSTRISSSFVDEAKDYIINNIGNEYYKGVHKTSIIEGQQDAHECIRPTSVNRTPESIKPYLSSKEYKLYKLIYERTLSSLMSDKKVLSIQVDFKGNDNYIFRLEGNKTLFSGYDYFKYDEKDDPIPDFQIGELCKVVDKTIEDKETKPPLRYSEGKMVKLMEDEGIGRPSTYSSTIQTLKDRNYVKSEKGLLTPTEKGLLTSKVLTKYFPSIINVEYTAEMEKKLDQIQNGNDSELEVLKEFYYPFLETYNDVKERMYKEPLKKTGETCPLCGSDLVERHGKYGMFVSCSNYPNCKYIKKEEKVAPALVGRDCPKCGHPLLYRTSKRGSRFIGCSNFPTCRYIEDIEELKIKNDVEKVCPECGSKLVVKHYRNRSFLGCSNYPNCKHTESIKK